VTNLVSHNKGRAKIEGDSEQGAGRIFGRNRDEVAGGWRRLHNEELHNLYTSPNIIRVIRSSRMRWTVHVARLEEVISSYQILVGNLEGRKLGKTRGRRENN
jgi:hypothetical protein